jgi:protein-tyrosine phosphatase
MPEIIDWGHATDFRPVVQCAARALADGELVAFPTETVYALAASVLIPEAVERLRQSKRHGEDRPMPLALRSPAEALDWVPDMSRLGRRLTRRCWPGPVTLVFSEGVEQGLISRLDPSVRRRVCPSGSLGLRVSGHPALQQTMQLLPGPLVLTGAGRSGTPAATTAAEVVAILGEEVGVVVDDGPSPRDQPATVVRIEGNSWSVLRPGVVSEAALLEQTACLILFVCTGNTCRSPLAESLCKKKLADCLGCAVTELPQRGFQVYSAGLAAILGTGAAPQAIETASAFGADLAGHRSRPLTEELAQRADYIVAMTRSHLLSLGEFEPHPEGGLRLLAPDGTDLADPIGGDEQVYQQCAELIWQHLGTFLAEITLGLCHGA